MEVSVYHGGSICKAHCRKTHDILIDRIDESDRKESLEVSFTQSNAPVIKPHYLQIISL